MFKSLRVPDKLFELLAWTVSLVFAGFLIALGSEVIGRLPGVQKSVQQDSFIPPAALARLRAGVAANGSVRSERSAARDRAQGGLDTARNKYQSARETFDAWITTRTATTDPQQDPEVIKRRNGLEQLKASERAAQAQVEQLDAGLLLNAQTSDSLRKVETLLNESARPAFESEQRRLEWSVFLIRLIMTLPLVVIAAWLVARQRKNEKWPLLRGFVMFALFAFFFELVPYLPSYGGYVRDGVGVVLTFVAGLYVIRTMRIYVAKRQVVEQQSESERRRTLGYEDAIRKMNAGVCPGCERAIAGGLQSPSNFCVHCGLNLFDSCNVCSIRKNAFYQYCPSCGVTTAARAHSATRPLATVPGLG
ncbi:MAG: zinc ribbon domain-containing protein [Gemmatimonadota bacterium]|nr:zinc ribbon domain-containing protein [Gemmatimonadota bacterium]